MYMYFLLFPDIDECENATRCGFQCNNYYGGFECLCPPGFMLANDDRRCVGKKDKKFSSSQDIA